MLTHPTHARLVELGLIGMAKALDEQQRQPDIAALAFDERLALLVDREATERARSYFEGNPPTSPAVAILRDGKLVYLMQRFVIEQATAQQIAGDLIRAFDQFCAKATA